MVSGMYEPVYQHSTVCCLIFKLSNKLTDQISGVLSFLVNIKPWKKSLSYLTVPYHGFKTLNTSYVEENLFQLTAENILKTLKHENT